MIVVELFLNFFGKTLPFICFCMSVFVTYGSNTCCACYHSATILGLIPVKQVDSTSHAPRYLGQPSAMPSPAPLTTSYILIYAMAYFKQTKPKQDNYILSSNQFFISPSWTIHLHWVYSESRTSDSKWTFNDLLTPRGDYWQLCGCFFSATTNIAAMLPLKPNPDSLVLLIP